jgi:hypothetical protein
MGFIAKLVRARFIRRGALGLTIALTVSGCDVALWRMNELSGSTVNDSVRAHHGTSQNVSLGQPGHDGTAYGFNGVSSVVKIPHADDLNPGGSNFSYGAWVKFTALPPPETFDVMRKGTSSSSGGYYKLELFTSNNTARARCYAKGSSGNAGIAGGTNLNDGLWHQLTCTRTGSQWAITVDGTQFSETDGFGNIANTAQVTIGAKPTNDDFYNGLIDDARITVG